MYVYPHMARNHHSFVVIYVIVAIYQNKLQTNKYVNINIECLVMQSFLILQRLRT